MKKGPDAKRQLEDLEAAFSALAHAARRQILLTIWFRGGTVTSSEIAKRFAHSWPTTTRHLRVLEEAGLLKSEKDGRNRLYTVDRSRLESVKAWLGWFFEESAQ